MINYAFQQAGESVHVLHEVFNTAMVSSIHSHLT